MQIEKLVMMANQIAAFFAAQGEARAVPQIAKHIENFWDPRMRSAIVAHAAASGAGLRPLTLAAVQRLTPSRAVAASAAGAPHDPSVNSERP
jgi:formate dehydrogenase subunit delta